MSVDSSFSKSRQVEMAFLDRSKSSKHTKIMQHIMEKNYRKQSGSFHDLNIVQDSHSARKMMLESHQKENPGLLQHKESPATHLKQSKQKISPLPTKYQLNIFLYVLQVVLAYGILIGLSYLYRLSPFPYFQLIGIFGLTISIQPLRVSNMLVLTSAIIAIVNNFIKMSILTYPSILICYFSTIIFNEKYKHKILFILALGIDLIFAFLILPVIYRAFPDNSKQAFYYIFPILMLILRSANDIIYWFIGYSHLTYLQLPLFLTGLEYGMILLWSPNDILFWYLMVFYTLQILNQRSHFLLQIYIRIIGCFEKKPPKMRALIAQSSAYTCIHSFHLFVVVYIFGYLPLYSGPYSSSQTLGNYVNYSYNPVIIFLLGSVYEILSILMSKKRKDKLLFGYVETGVKGFFLRTLLLVLGLWIFYLGLGIANFVKY